ncbi:recombinase family protein [Streptomyces sp. WAC00263]|uniref:recombinase family protein n=1 Tax=Streptomyces sp. WAC00263 TaxID=1917422 RepID=UPI001F514CA5|nr:recombinase family protein [Streptomyces sp. WAC00263]
MQDQPSGAGKVTADQLRRGAYLYVRQSSLKQVVNNTESTQRQYALRGRAIALGWDEGQITVIDTDQGQSGASAAGRDGFQHLVSEVSLGRAGIVLGLEVSRLARNSTDWHRLLEICALTGTLILDEDGLYDPRSFNDRLVLGLKGTMSEAELHLLKARLRGGQLSKARRGELKQALPSAMSTIFWTGSSRTPTWRSVAPSSGSSRCSRRPARPARSSSPSPPTSCPSPPGSAPVRTKASWSGAR